MGYMKKETLMKPFILVYRFFKYVGKGLLVFLTLGNINKSAKKKPVKSEPNTPKSTTNELKTKITKERLQASKLAEKIVQQEQRKLKPSFLKQLMRNIRNLVKNIFKGIRNFIRRIIYGFLAINYVVYRIIKLNIMAVLFPFYLVKKLIENLMSFSSKTALQTREKIINKSKLKVKTRKSKLIGDKVKKLSPKELAKQTRLERKQKIIEAKAEAKRKKQARQLAERERREELAAKRKAEEVYFKRQKQYGRNIDRKKPPRDFTERIVNIPKDIKTYFQSRIDNLSIVRNKKNRLALEREALLMSVESEESVKSDIKLLYVYVARDPDGKLVRGQFEAHSKVEVHSFLLNEGYEVYSIKTNRWITFVYGNPKSNKKKIKTSDLVFFLTQLSTYLKAGITLVESLKILTKQYKKNAYQRIFKTMVYDLTMGESFSSAMEKQGVAFPKLLINMVKAAEMTGELPEALDNMSEYYAEIEKTRKQMVTALIYPVMVVILAVGVITFIILFVIPRFVEIYATLDADQIPSITTFIIGTSSFMQAYIIHMVIGLLVFLVVLNYLYKSVKIFKIFAQWLLMHTPVFKNIVIYNEVTVFSKTFSSLLAHNVFITDSMEVLNSITENEIYKMIILDTVNNLAKGEKISESFRNHWAFPNPAYEMLVTGEKTGQLPEMMEKVSVYYQELHRDAVARLKTVIEPALIIVLTLIVGIIVLSVIIPMFNMFTMIQQ